MAEQIALPGEVDFLRLCKTAHTMGIPEPTAWVKEHVEHLGGKLLFDDHDELCGIDGWDWDKHNKVAMLIGDVAPAYITENEKADNLLKEMGNPEVKEKRKKKKSEAEQAALALWSDVAELEPPPAPQQDPIQLPATINDAVEVLTGVWARSARGGTATEFRITDDTSMKWFIKVVRQGQKYIESLAEEVAREIELTTGCINFLMAQFDSDLREFNEPKINLERKPDGSYKRKSISYATAGGRLHFQKRGGWALEAREEFIAWLSEQPEEVQAEFKAKPTISYDYQSAVRLAEKYKPPGWRWTPENHLAKMAVGDARAWTPKKSQDRLAAAFKASGIVQVAADEDIEAEVIEE